MAYHLRAFSLQNQYSVTPNSSYARALETHREELQTILTEIEHVVKFVPHQTVQSIFRIFLGFDPFAEVDKSLSNEFGRIISNVLSLTNREWLYDSVIYDSDKTASNAPSHARRFNQVLVRFVNNTVEDHEQASADQSLNIIYIRGSWLGHINTYATFSLRQYLYKSLKPGDLLDDLFDRPLPILLHEFLHLSVATILDLEIPNYKAQSQNIPSHLRSSVETSGVIQVYTNQACRALAILSNVDNSMILARNVGRVTSHGCTFGNAESLTRAIITLWLTTHRYELDFACEIPGMSEQIQVRMDIPEYSTPLTN